MPPLVRRVDARRGVPACEVPRELSTPARGTGKSPTVSHHHWQARSSAKIEECLIQLNRYSERTFSCPPRVESDDETAASGTEVLVGSSVSMPRRRVQAPSRP